MNNFSKLMALMVALSLSACAQFGAKKKEPEIQARIDTASTNYLNCMKAYATKYASATDSAAILVEGAGVECGDSLQLVEADMRELLSMKYMSKSYQTKLLAEQMLSLEKQARAQVVDTVVKARVGEL